MYEEKRSLAGLSGHEILRQRAFNDYYKNPNICKNCKEVIKIKKGEQASYTRKKKFCSKSCSTSYNNMGVTRHGRSEKYKCPRCSNKKSGDAVFCHSCMLEDFYVKHKMTSLEEISMEGNSRYKWGQVRKWGRNILKMSGRKFKCEFCDENCILDVCHIKPISDFPEDTLCGEVNAIDNLIYLCPTHHRYLDKGWIDLNGDFTDKCPCNK